ncbi:MAG TPA: PQQ-binding-like beta-propeller repeat protein [Ktedonobacteraceae bacterium]
MYEPAAARQQRLAYEKMLYRYSTALEDGDFATIIALLKIAEQDPYLEQMLIEAHNEGYLQEERNMQQNDLNSQLTQPRSSSSPTLPTPSLPGQARKPRKRWLIALERTIAVLVVVLLVGSALFLFAVQSRQQTRGGSTKVGAQKTVAVGIVVAASVQGLTARNVATGAILWQNTVLGKIDLNAPIGLTSAAHMVYAAYNKQVWAFQLSDGKVLWHQTLGTADSLIVRGDPLPQLVVEQNIVYASGYSSGNLYALDVKTGKILWSYNAPLPALLTISKGIAYVLINDSNDQNGVKALQGTNGHVLWHYNSSMPLSATVSANVFYMQTSHSLVGDPTGQHKEQKPLIALNATNGSKIWSTIAPANGPSPLVVAQGMLILFDGNHFCGYRISDQKLAWCTAGPENDINGSGLISVNGIVYGIYNPSFEASLVEAIDPQNGRIYWSKDIGFGSSDGNTWLLSQGNDLILLAAQTVLSRANGDVLWKFPASVLAATVSVGA